MKKKILLIDPSLTVQKVVSLTLDRNRFQVVNAKTRAEALRFLTEGGVDLILVSDQVPEITASSFPKELELLLGRGQKIPQCILITAQDVKDARHYAAVLKKPFTPQNLQLLVHEHLRADAEQPSLQMDESGQAPPAKEVDPEFEVAFNQRFSDEADLVKETFKGELESSDPTLFNLEDLSVESAVATQEISRASDEEDLWSQKPDFTAPLPASPEPVNPVGDLWGLEAPADEINEGTVAMTLPLEEAPAPGRKSTAPIPPVPGAVPFVKPTAPVNNAVAVTGINPIAPSIDETQLMRLVAQAVEKMVPPIVEKLVKEKLDQLLKEQEQWIDSKP